AGAIPLLPDAVRLAEQGCATRAATGTLQHLGTRLSVTGVPDALVTVLADAQTSGGLLISMPADRVAQFTAALDRIRLADRSRAACAPVAAVIGDAMERRSAVIELTN